MRQTQSVAVLLLGIIVGCAAERILVVPPARAGTTPQRWEYSCESAIQGITAMANRYGQEGWELTAAAGYGAGLGLSQEEKMVWCFKRPLP